MIKQLSSREIKNIGIKEEYEYDFFLIEVFKSIDGYVEVTAYDKYKEIFIRKVNNMPAILTVENAYIEKQSEAVYLIDRLKEASNLLEIINNDTNLLEDLENNREENESIPKQLCNLEPEDLYNVLDVFKKNI